MKYFEGEYEDLKPERQAFTLEPSKEKCEHWKHLPKIVHSREGDTATCRCGLTATAVHEESEGAWWEIVDTPPKEKRNLPVRYADKAMFEAEPIEEAALERPRVHLLSATPDPLGAVAAFSMMYEGRVIRDLAEITDDERRHYFDESLKTALRTPLEAIDFHFMVEGLTRATFDQMRTQRTAVFAAESLRFAVKEHLAESVRPGPNVQSRRAKEIHDNAVLAISQAYHALIGEGVPAEDARGLMPMNILTRANYKTNLRNLEAEVGKRLCTQAQFEWRLIHLELRQAIREYDQGSYHVKGHPKDEIRVGSNWQFEYIANSNMFKPICFQKGSCMFMSDMDRGCTIRERVERGAFDEIEVREWLLDPTAGFTR